MRLWNDSLFLRDSKFKKIFFSKSNQVTKMYVYEDHQVFVSPDSHTKFPYNHSIDVEVHCAVIEYEDGKAKPAHYLIRFRRS